MDITRATTVETRRGRAEWFTGAVWQDPIVEAPDPARIKAVRVTFEPGARTAWHTHPLGQTLHVVSGIGRVQTWGGPVLEIRPGDTVWIPPDEKHWHGAAPTSGMVHIALHEHRNGTHVTWMEHVTDEQYGAAPTG
ncbi:MAG TPA: cupin domain-containing protein [Beijerinckiaceae bacterium]